MPASLIFIHHIRRSTRHEENKRSLRRTPLHEQGSDPTRDLVFETEDMRRGTSGRRDVDVSTSSIATDERTYSISVSRVTCGDDFGVPLVSSVSRS
jgi:hypothetical protein